MDLVIAIAAVGIVAVVGAARFLLVGQWRLVASLAAGVFIGSGLGIGPGAVATLTALIALRWIERRRQAGDDEQGRL